MPLPFRGCAPRCPIQDSFRVFTLALISAITTPLAFAQDPDVQKADASPRVDLRVPSPLLRGRTYLAELTVETATQIQDAYVKLSLPYALQIQSGKPYYRGMLPVGSPITISVRFRVSGSPAAPIIGKLVSYDNFGQPTFGKAEILYCKVVEDSIVLSEENPLWETALRLEQKVRTQVPPPLLEVLVEERRRSITERWTAKETTGPTYTDSLAEVQPLLENTSISARLQGVPAAYRFKGHAGDRIWITVEAEDFDPRVLLLRSNGQVVAEDDDGFGPTNARIPAQGVFELASDDSYILVIGSHNQEAKGAYRLRVENFTHLEPSPGVVLQSKGNATLDAATPSQAVDVILSGQIQYNSLTGAAPVRLALVQLFADRFLAVDPVVAISQTDTNGTVSFRVPQANVNGTLYFRVYTRDRDGRIASVEDPLLENVFERRSLHQAEGFRFSLPGSANVTFGTWNLAGTGRNGPFLIFDAAIEGYLIATEIPATTLPRITVVYPIRDLFSIFPNPFDPDAHYVNREIFLADGYETSPDVVLHECGHFISDVKGFRQTQGGRHPVPFKERVNPSLAWGEGWASFFAVAVQNARRRPSKRTFVSNHPRNSQNYDLEDGHDPSMIRQAVAGDDNEGSVQFILWDLYDNSQDALPVAGSVDRVSLGLKTVFDIARQGAVLLAVDNSLKLFPIDHLVKFYDGLFQQLPFARTQTTPIWNVFADQSIRWERPPAPPTALRFEIVAGALQLRWEAGTGNEVVFEVQRKLPGQSSFDDVAAVSETTYEIPSVTVGTTFRVRANAVNQARFIALLPSNWSQELTYFEPPSSPPVIFLSSAQLEFSFQIGGTLPPPQSVEITNTGGGTLSWTASSNATWLLASPTRGTAPSLITISVDPTQLSARLYNGTITVSSPSAATKSVSVTLDVSAATPAISAVVNAASFRAGVVPGSLATLFGRNLLSIEGIEFPGGVTSHKGITVTVAGRRSPLLGLADVEGQEQINFQVPFDLATSGNVLIEVIINGSVADTENAPLLRVQPGIFGYNPTGSAVIYAAAVKPDGSVIGPNNPVSRGGVFSMFLTGLGPTQPMLATGQLGPVPPAETVLQPIVGIGNEGMPVLFSGYAPGFIGLYQINVRVNENAPVGSAVALDVVVDGVPSQTSRIAVR